MAFKKCNFFGRGDSLSDPEYDPVRQYSVSSAIMIASRIVLTAVSCWLYGPPNPILSLGRLYKDPIGVIPRFRRKKALLVDRLQKCLSSALLRHGFKSLAVRIFPACTNPPARNFYGIWRHPQVDEFSFKEDPNAPVEMRIVLGSGEIARLAAEEYRKDKKKLESEQ